MSNSKEEINVKKLYGKECTLPKDEFIKNYNFSENGLTSSKANSLLNNLGPNEIKQAKPKRWYHYFIEVVSFG